MAKTKEDRYFAEDSFENAALLESQRLRDLRIFHDVARALTSALDLNSILHALMEQMAMFFKPDTWSLLMVDEERKDLYYTIAVGEFADRLRDIRVPFGEGMSGWVVTHGEALIVPDMTQEDRFDSFDSVGGAPVRSLVCMPVRYRFRTLAVIQLLNCKFDTLSDYAIFFLHVLTDYAAIAIENAHHVDRIHKLTITDDCTGLHNARFLYTSIEEELRKPHRAAQHLSLVFIDLDHFKSINDTHGHLVGSALLGEIGATIRETLRPGDVAFRYGGDEFVILLPQTSKRGAIEAASKLLNKMRATRYMKSAGLSLTMRASIGVATYPEDGTDVHSIIRAADIAMYDVKNSTRDSVAAANVVTFRPGH